MRKLSILALAVCVSPAHSALIGYWDFEGSTTESITGSTAGILVGGATTSGGAIAPGSTSALSLVTAGDHFDTGLDGTTISGLGHTPDGSGSPDKTILFWFNTSYTDGIQTLFNYSPEGGAGYGLNFRALILADGTLRMEVSSGFDILDLGSPLNGGNNHMIAFIFKKGDTLGDVDVYLDGTLLDGPGSNTRLIDTKATKLSSASYLLFGTDYASRHAVGLIDDVAIFDEALSLAELDSIAANGVLPVSPPFLLSILPDGPGSGSYGFSWASQDGKVYDLVSAKDLSSPPESWPVWEGQADLAATPPTNTLASIPGGGDGRRFFAVVEKDLPPLLTEDFEGGSPAGWTYADNGAGTAWTVGTPDGTGTGPDAANGGTLCAGTNMNANYTASATASIVTPAFTVPAGGATLDLSYYIDTEAPSGGADFGSIRLLDASDDSPLAGGEIAADLQGISVMWINGSFPLPAAANGLEVKIEFSFESDPDTAAFAGFYIDDVFVKAN